MSRILRRPMFRGGSLNNEGIMSYAQPRKGYAGEDGSFVQNSEDSTMNEEESGYTSNEEKNINPQIIQTLSNNIQKQKSVPAQTGEKKSYSDVLMEEYLGNRSDPASKFLINFGLNYMSARPRGGKFGAITTAADAAKKPTEQLYADMDTDRLLKLKLMGALSKSESKVALEKEANLLVQEGIYKTKGEALSALVRGRLEKKELSISDKINEQYKDYRKGALTQGGELKDKNKAEIVVRDIEKLGKSKEKVDLDNPWLENIKLQTKPNSTDVEIPGATESVLKRYTTGNIYISPNNRMSYEYLGKNTFRPVTKL
jgi:hypothetical protein